MMKNRRGGERMAAVRDGMLVAMLVAGVVPAAGATTFTVNNTVDAVDANPGDGICQTAVANQCTLRAAIQEANALAGADVIELPAGIYDLTAGTDAQIANENGSNDGKDIAFGDLDITSALTINGAGASSTIIDGMKRDRLFQVHEGGDAAIRKVTIRNGSQSNNGMGGGLSVRTNGKALLEECNVTKNIGRGFGGGLDNFMGTLIVRRCAIYGNGVYGVGAGVSNMEGKLEIYDSTIRDNQAAQFTGLVMGGGVYNAAAVGYAKIHGTLISGHSVLTDGGGIYHQLGVLELVNSTISGNEARRNGGGVYIANRGIFREKNVIRHTTITGNRANGVDSSNLAANLIGGGGLYHGNPTNSSDVTTTSIQNSLIAGNTVLNGLGTDCHNIGILERAGSLLGDGCVNAPVTLTAGQIGLGLLSDNGGPTKTHALSDSSQAVGLGVADYCLAKDQRGYGRPASGCDAGAFERDGTLPSQQVTPPPPAGPGTSTDGQNRAPLSFSMPYAVVAGGVLHGVLNSVDADGDFIGYEIVQQPQKGRVGLVNFNGGENLIPGGFEYVANESATGGDFFTYRACDKAGACSNVATISISIDSSVAPTHEIKVTVEEGGGTSSGIIVTSPANLQVVAPDPNYTYPLGGFFFDVTDIPAVSGDGGTVVVIQLPANAEIAANAVVRKMDNTGTWQTLQSSPNPVESTGTIDRVAKTITLVLRDNDRYDLNPAIGVIRDPVAIGVPKAAADTGTSTSGGGGGALHLLALGGLLLALAVRRRRLH